MFVFESAWAVVVIYYCGVVACVSANRLGTLLRSLVEGFSWTGLGLSATAGVAVFVVTLVVWPYAVRDGFNLAVLFSSFGLKGFVLGGFVVGALIVNPVMEELLWRGVLDVKSKGPCGIDLAFGGFHVPVLWLAVKWPYVVAGFVGLCAASWGFRWARDRFGGLAVPWLAHLTGDLAIVLALGWVW